MRTFKEQRREFIELALKLIDKHKENYLLKVDDKLIPTCEFFISIGGGKSVDCSIVKPQNKPFTMNPFDRDIEYEHYCAGIEVNEKEIQKLRNLVGELG